MALKDGVEVTAMVGVPVAEVTVMLVPAVKVCTPLFVRVTEPVALDIPRYEEPVSDCTPVLVKVTVEGEVEVPMEIPVPGEKMKLTSVSPAMVEVTNGLVFAMVTVPVALDTEIPVPAVADCTPRLVRVILPAPFCMPIAVPGERVESE